MRTRGPLRDPRVDAFGIKLVNINWKFLILFSVRRRGSFGRKGRARTPPMVEMGCENGHHLPQMVGHATANTVHTKKHAAKK